MEENIKINSTYVCFKVADYALASALKALNDCGVYDITVTKENDGLVVVYSDNNEYFGNSCIGKCNGCKHQ